MKRLIMCALIALSANASAYNIGGAYAVLLGCKWGQYGYQYGNIGTYDVNGQIYQVFFGNSFCRY